MEKRKAAVVIGVDKTGNLAKLKSAAAGADAVATWLQDEGYDVECLTDKQGPVRSRDVEDAISKFVTLPVRYSLLVVYFSGHGYWHARSDRWLLSGAPTKTSEAINLNGAMDLARYSGIPNVVFISDACRSIPDSRTGAHVTGIDAFPNYADTTGTSKIDVFKATSEARAAYEGDIGGQNKSILTHALMLAYTEPKPDMIHEVIEGARLMKVVPNRKLEDYLQDKVDDLLADIDINLTQNIEANVPSSDDIYIAHIRPGTRVPVLRSYPGSPPPAEPGVRAGLAVRAVRAGRDAAGIVGRALSAPATRGGASAVHELLAVANPETEAALTTRLPSVAVDHFESRMGFVIHGESVVNAATTKGVHNARVEIVDAGDGRINDAIVRVWDADPAVSVAIQVEGGRCCVLAALEGYIGHAYFDEAGLSNISYVPSSNHWRFGIYEQKKDEIDRLRALVALAVQNNTFEIHSDQEAEALASEIRMEKATDPTLGLYAAHALSQAGKDDSVLSVLDYMRHDLRTDLFDVRVLASRHVDQPWGSFPVAPFCPLLTQTWSLLRPRGITLPMVLQEASPYLCNSLWTTFEPKAAQHIIQAVETGELQ